MEEKLRIFFDLARKINGKFSVIPLLYGSVGLQMLIEDDLQPDDIDICVPQHLYRLNERWRDLRAFMQSEGYELVDENERFFRKDGLCVNFGVIDGDEANAIPSIEIFAGIDPADIPIFQTDGAIYKRLTLEQYYRVYSKSFEDGYRADERGHKDQGKIDVFKKMFDHD